MLEEESIKFAALHMEGITHEWWNHGIFTLDHDQITSYSNFMEILIDHFNRKDLELNFKELAQLKKTGLVESYIIEF